MVHDQAPGQAAAPPTETTETTATTAGGRPINEDWAATVVGLVLVILVLVGIIGKGLVP